MRAPKKENPTPANEVTGEPIPLFKPHRVVGVGASAGGLEAFEQFLRGTSAVTGLSFVLIQHLDPSHESALVDILQRYSSIPIVEAEDGAAVEADHVYVIPPNCEMTISNGALRLAVPDTPRGKRTPIDAFFRSLAEEVGAGAVGVVLSGTGTDGTLGLCAIKEAGGLTLAQEPASAKYDGMPSSAINAGCAEHIVRAEEMVAAILSSQNRVKAPTDGPLEESINVGVQAALARLLLVLRTATGHDFSSYKKSTLLRRVERRMAQHELSSIELYTRYLKKTPIEAQSLFKELLINVSSFFRDPEAFEALGTEVLSKLIKERPDGYVIRIWVAGCATGEEAYSIAILLRELMDNAQRELKVQLYSTDLDDDAIAAARIGLYPHSIAADVPLERLRRFFAKEEQGYRIKKEIREMVVFAVQSVIKDPPFTRLDLISCRNLMIYLEAELQDRLIPIFHYALRTGGALLLSPSESIGNHPDLFAPISRKWKLYRASQTLMPSQRSVLERGVPWTVGGGQLAQEEADSKLKVADIGDLSRRALLRIFAPPSVVTDRLGNILYVYGETRRFLGPAPGQPTLNVIEMASDRLQLELRTALNSASKGEQVLGREVWMKSGDEVETLVLSVRPIGDPGTSSELLLISFQPAGTPGGPVRRRRKRAGLSTETARAIDLEHQLISLREGMQATIEEHQSINEDFKSSNEELQSTNEELQSTNEELETSREELQSVNEELITVNAELLAKIDQLGLIQNDMKNLFDNVSDGTIFLDRKLLIRRFTRAAALVYPLVASDLGRPLANIKSGFPDDDLLLMAQKVIDTLQPYDREIRARDGAYYRVRIQPYRTTDDVIAGVVMTFSNISARVEAQTAEHEARLMAEGIINTIRHPMMVLDGVGRVISASRAYYQYFRTNPASTINKSIYLLSEGTWDKPELRELLENILPQKTSFDDFEFEAEFPGIGNCKLRLNARRIVSPDHESTSILLAMEPVSIT